MIAEIRSGRSHINPCIFSSRYRNGRSRTGARAARQGNPSAQLRICLEAVSANYSLKLSPTRSIVQPAANLQQNPAQVVAARANPIARDLLSAEYAIRIW